MAGAWSAVERVTGESISFASMTRFREQLRRSKRRCVEVAKCALIGQETKLKDGIDKATWFRRLPDLSLLIAGKRLRVTVGLTAL